MLSTAKILSVMVLLVCSRGIYRPVISVRITDSVCALVCTRNTELAGLGDTLNTEDAVLLTEVVPDTTKEPTIPIPWCGTQT